jgi:putative peptidoglycan lipid II flippase
MSKALAKSTTLVSSMTFISRILGFVRDMIVAQVFGVTAAVDAFNVAFKIPNFMRNLFAEGSFSQAFVPVLSNYRQTREKEEVRIFISYIAGALGLILLLITFLGVLGAPLLIKLFGPGLDPYRFQLASEMLRVTFPYLMLISLTAFSSAILNSYGVFSVPSLTPALLNVCLIIAALGFAQYFKVPIEVQAWGVLIAGFVQFFFQLPFLYHIGFLTRPRLNWKDAGVQRVLKLMIPSLFGASVAQVSLLLNTIFASFLKVGSVTWLYYSERLAYFPLGVFGVALLTVVLPSLARQHSSNSKEGFASTLDWGIRCNLLIGIPAALTMLILAGPLVATLFAYKKFTVFDVLMTRESVIAYSVGLQSFMLAKVLSAAFYAQQDMRTPVRIAVITVCASIVLNAILIFPLAHAGLALATSLGSWISTILLTLVLYKKDIYRFQKGWGKFALRLIFANLVVAVWLRLGGGNLIEWLNWHWQQRVLHLLFLGVTAIFIYLFCLWLSGMRLKDFKASVQV